MVTDGAMGLRALLIINIRDETNMLLKIGMTALMLCVEGWARADLTALCPVSGTPSGRP